MRPAAGAIWHMAACMQCSRSLPNSLPQLWVSIQQCSDQLLASCVNVTRGTHMHTSAMTPRKLRPLEGLSCLWLRSDRVQKDSVVAKSVVEGAPAGPELLHMVAGPAVDLHALTTIVQGTVALLLIGKQVCAGVRRQAAVHKVLWVAGRRGGQLHLLDRIRVQAGWGVQLQQLRNKLTWCGVGGDDLFSEGASM